MDPIEGCQVWEPFLAFLLHCQLNTLLKSPSLFDSKSMTRCVRYSFVKRVYLFGKFEAEILASIFNQLEIIHPHIFPHTAKQLVASGIPYKVGKPPNCTTKTADLALQQPKQ